MTKTITTFAELMDPRKVVRMTRGEGEALVDLLEKLAATPDSIGSDVGYSCVDWRLQVADQVRKSLGMGKQPGADERAMELGL